ncbi:Hypothetical protein FKW44_008080 [Caligus rogercresseyi]|uniref:Uncharacterized protein n=1 Tax=Caligus rogercresseyi TaxID=217165 RepID=A0A7T8QU08_CALRO|nr:Hypothetical protein FKW44_008080 [Caligus rogercresseyi]
MGQDMLNFIKSSYSSSLRLFSDEKRSTMTALTTGRTPRGSARLLRTCPWSSSPRTRTQSWSWA